MIARLRGEVIEALHNRIVIDCHGVGYEVLTSERTATAFGTIGNTVDLHIRHIVREDDQTLYGFPNPTERRLFDILREVKGCGAKISLNIIGTLGLEATIGFIATQDVKGLIQVSGVGQRMAERINVELKDKIQEFAFDQKVAHAVVSTRSKNIPINDELVEALISLGYKRSESEDAANAVRDENTTVNEQLRLALKSLSK